MSYTRSDIEKYAKRVQLDLLDCQKKLGRLMEMVMSLPIPETPNQFTCGDCAQLAFSTQQRLEQHRENVHGEFVPTIATPQSGQYIAEPILDEQGRFNERHEPR